MSKLVRSLVCVMLSITMVLSMSTWAGVPVAAEETAVQPRYSYANYISASINLYTDGTANCYAYVNGYDDVTEIHIQMILQKSIKRRWTDMASWEGTWTKTYASLSRSTTVTTGTYRVKAVYTIYSGSAYEEITAYSQEQYVLVST